MFYKVAIQNKFKTFMGKQLQESIFVVKLCTSAIFLQSTTDRMFLYDFTDSMNSHCVKSG